MGYAGKGLRKHAQGIVEPTKVEERPNNFGLGYFQSYGKNSTTKFKAFETTQRRNFVASSNPQTCQVFIQDE